MISFVIPLRAARTTADWQQTSRLLSRTVRSISRQTHPAFDIIVVCEDLPDPLPREAAVSFLHLTTEGTPDAWPAGEQDKAARLRHGFQEALARGSTHVVPTDADDCVSRHLVAHAQAHPEVRAWRFERGYVWPEGSAVAYLKRRHFHDVCGTSIMASPDICLQMFRTGPLFDQEPMPDDAQWFDHRGPDLDGVRWQPLPRPGALYSIYNGTNIRMSRSTALGLQAQRGRMRFYAERLRTYRPVSARWLQRDFGPLDPV